ncbi:flagellar protein FlgN [Guptibacillus algicola]|uniref:flagellar protein FlgN n=1 Tax=Guptibacillus algicola TaxID=225844 RepID=UPI001CD5D750|nr:flagellar protein FlgN [Alkalihalobacillus algicola]MCA0988898.1 flagellar protein FlgN [Alkalihalobacillus algicola]
MGQQLLATMSNMITLHEKLMSLGELKKEALIERDVNSLSEMMKNERELLQALSVEEEKRQELVERLGGSGQTLKEVLTKLSPAVRRMIESRAITLKEKAEALRTLNEQNDVLLKDAMAFVHHMIGHLTASPEQSLTYTRPNQKPASSTPRGYFDTKA